MGSSHSHSSSSPSTTDSSSGCPMKNSSSRPYDVYSRPLSTPPTAHPTLPSPSQVAPLSTARRPSSIPQAHTDGQTWTYPSPQMFYNALVRKNKHDPDSEEHMESVVKIHNQMNEDTWAKVRQWEAVMGSQDPKLLKFRGRPTELSPKACVKYCLGHPLPFDRHDWTVMREDGQQVRYVIDYYYQEGIAENESDIERGQSVKSIHVDVRPAVEGWESVWGRLVAMPLARRGCESVWDCVGGKIGNKSEFQPLPLIPSEGLRKSVDESRRVWENIQKDAAKGVGVGPKDQADSRNVVVPSVTTKEEAAELANTYSKILVQCHEAQIRLQKCQGEEDCEKAFMGMTVCAGKIMCPLQHKTLLDSLETITSDTNNAQRDVAETRVNAAVEVLGECVANYDARASAAKKLFPETFSDLVKK